MSMSDFMVVEQILATIYYFTRHDLIRRRLIAAGIVASERDRFRFLLRLIGAIMAEDRRPAWASPSETPRHLFYPR
jgi:hypothetical protein